MGIPVIALVLVVLIIIAVVIFVLFKSGVFNKQDVDDSNNNPSQQHSNNDEEKESIKYITNPERRGDAYVRIGEMESAVKAYNEALSADQKNIPLHNKLIELYEELGKDDLVLAHSKMIKNIETKDKKVSLTLADMLYQSGDYQSAIPEFEACLEQLPKNEETLYKTGMCYYHTNKYNNAVECFKKLSAHSINKYNVKECLEEVLEKTDNLAAAIDIYRKMYNENTRNDYSREKLAKALYQLGERKYNEQKYKEAEKLLDEASELGIETYELFLNLGKIAYQFKDFEKSLHLFKKALKLDPQNIDIIKAIADCLDNKGDVNESLMFYSNAIKDNPDDYKLRCVFGAALCSKSDIESALKELKESVKINPDYAEAHYNLGVAYEKKKEFEKAVEEYKITLDFRPDHLEAKRNLKKLVGDSIIQMK